MLVQRYNSNYKSTTSCFRTAPTKEIFYIFLVIEVSCGEYGDNIKNLVNAIRNGKHDVREGYPFPEKEVLNNSSIKDGEAVPTDGVNAKDKNDANCIEDKFPESKVNDKTNGGIISNYAKNDIIKQSTLSRFNRHSF